jgi:hypothetical protein
MTGVANMHRERREKIVRLDERYLLAVMAGLAEPIQNYGLPEDAEVLGVYYNPSCRALDVLVSSATFDIVHSCQETPVENLLRLNAVSWSGESPLRDVQRAIEAGTWRDRPSML